MLNSDAYGQASVLILAELCEDHVWASMVQGNSLKTALMDSSQIQIAHFKVVFTMQCLPKRLVYEGHKWELSCTSKRAGAFWGESMHCQGCHGKLNRLKVLVLKEYVYSTPVFFTRT